MQDLNCSAFFPCFDDLSICNYLFEAEKLIKESEIDGDNADYFERVAGEADRRELEDASEWLTPRTRIAFKVAYIFFKSFSKSKTGWISANLNLAQGIF